MALIQEINEIISGSMFAVGFPSFVQNQQNTNFEFQGFTEVFLREAAQIIRHISSVIDETPKNLFVTCIKQRWFDVAKWIFLNNLVQGVSYCETTIQEANRLMKKYENVYVYADVKHAQQVGEDLQDIIALVFLMGSMIRTYRQNVFQQNVSTRETLETLEKVRHKLVTTEQPLSLMSSFQLLISRIETESNEADLDPIKTDIDQRLPKVRTLLDLIHRGVNSVTLSKGEKAFSLIDLCIERRFFSTIQWLVGKGVPLRADQIERMFDVASMYLKESNAYLCEQEDLLSLLRLILQTAQQNMINDTKKKTLNN